MLRQRCRAFRALIGTAMAPEHRAGCSDCRRWHDSRELLTAYGSNQPLPEHLRDRLQALADTAAAPVPQAPLPAGLHRRLVAIPERNRSGRAPALPLWITRSRYAVAASLLLALLSVSAMGGTVGGTERSPVGSLTSRLAASRQTAAGYLRQAEAQLAAAEQWRRTTLGQLEETVVTLTRSSVGRAETWRSRLRQLRTSFTNWLTGWFSDLLPLRSNNHRNDRTEPGPGTGAKYEME